jgi:circadian clock protein KaiC
LRVVFDSLSELRLLASNPLRFRRQIMALKRFFSTREITVLMLDDMADEDNELQIATLAHGVVRLEQLNPEFGAERRRLRVMKYRATAYRGGYHDCVIRTGGLFVFPRLRAKDFRGTTPRGRVPSGIAELDALLGGGLERGTSTLFVGAAGTGKSSIAAQFVASAASRGERAAMFVFDERLMTLLARSKSLGIELASHVESGTLMLQQVDPADLSPGELSHEIRRAVEDFGASMVVIDSLNGYLNAMPEERFLIIQLHELLSYLGHAGVVTILIAAHQGLIGAQMLAPGDASYLADGVVMIRYFEAFGEVRQAISVMKNRAGNHERTVREFSLTPGKICVGPVLRDFRGVLTGVPVFEGASKSLQGKDAPA